MAEVGIKVEVEKDEEEEKYNDWRVDDAFCTLKRAEEYKKDPKMMAKVQEKISKEKVAIRSLEQLKSKASEVMSEEEED
jgi:hypothetical protein